MIKAILPAALLLLWCISVFAAMIGGVLTAILLVGLWFDLSLWPEFVSLFAVTTILLASMPDAVLKPHAFQIAEALGSSIDDVTSKLRNMLVQHSKEWTEFEQHLGENSFLKLWTKGGRHV